jgi:hypothetical protein
LDSPNPTTSPGRIPNAKGNISKSSINSLKFAIRVGADDIGNFPFTLRSLQKLGGENSHLILPVLSAINPFWNVG